MDRLKFKIRFFVDSGLATIIGLIISSTAAFSAAYTIHQNSRVIRVTERPYVSIKPWGGIDSSSVDFQSSKRITLLFKLTNNGRTPANYLTMTTKRAGFVYITDKRKVESVGQEGKIPVTLPAGSFERVGTILFVEEKDFEILKTLFYENKIFFIAEVEVKYKGMSSKLLEEGKTDYSVELHARGYEILTNSMR